MILLILALAGGLLLLTGVFQFAGIIERQHQRQKRMRRLEPAWRAALTALCEEHEKVLRQQLHFKTTMLELEQRPWNSFNTRELVQERQRTQAAIERCDVQLSQIASRIEETRRWISV